MTRNDMYLAMSQAADIGKELSIAAAFGAKHDPDLQWDVAYHKDEARAAFVKLAASLGYRVERVSELEAA